MKEYTIATYGKINICANSEEEALAKIKVPDDHEEFTASVVNCSIIDGTEIKADYMQELNMTVIVQYTYRYGELITEQIVGFYHGEPDDEMTNEFSTKGTVAVLM